MRRPYAMMLEEQLARHPYKRGLEIILKLHGGQVNLLPLALRTEFLGEQMKTQTDSLCVIKVKRKA